MLMILSLWTRMLNRYLRDRVGSPDRRPARRRRRDKGHLQRFVTCSAGRTMFHRLLLTSNEIYRAGGGPAENVKTSQHRAFEGCRTLRRAAPGLSCPDRRRREQP